MCVPTPARTPVALVIEDEALVRMFIVDQLQDLGFEVIDVGGASEGLRAARDREHLDVVIVDRGLPDRDGMDVVAELRTQLRSLPVIVASGYGDLPDASLRNDPNICPGVEAVRHRRSDDGAARAARADEGGEAAQSGTTAVASISTFAPCCTSATICTTDIVR